VIGFGMCVQSGLQFIVIAYGGDLLCVVLQSSAPAALKEVAATSIAITALNACPFNYRERLTLRRFDVALPVG
jgi:hypothetical protein